MTDALPRLAGMALAIVLAACSANSASSPAPTGPAGSQAPTMSPSPAPTGPEESPSPAVSDSPAPTGPVRLATEGTKCTNDRFTVEVPAGWWYAASGPSACFYFNREPFELAGSEPTIDVQIEIHWIEGDVGTFYEIINRKEFVIDGRPAVRSELRTGGEPGGFLPPNLLITQYSVQLGPISETGPNLLAETRSWFEEYLDNQKVLDEIMASLRFR